MYDFKKAVDLTQTLENGMPVYPGNPIPVFERTSTLEKNGVNLSKMELGSHTGTHVDAPRHFVSNGTSIDRIPVGHFIGEAVAVDLSNKPIGSGITAKDLEANLDDVVREGDIVLCYTGTSKYWGKSKMNTNYTYLTEDGAKYLVSKKVRAVGIDFLSVEKFKSSNPVAHKVLLEAGMFLIESLNNNLEQFVGQRLLFIGLPIKLKEGDGSPARCVAVPMS